MVDKKNEFLIDSDVHDPHITCLSDAIGVIKFINDDVVRLIEESCRKMHYVQFVPKGYLDKGKYVLTGFYLSRNTEFYDNIEPQAETDIVMISDDNDSFFNVRREEYDNLLGKTFKCDSLGSVIQVIGLSCSKEFEPYQFLYERYDKSFDGEWMPQDYIWLQEQTEDDYKFCCLTTQTEMNIASENMFHLGDDGNLYLGCDVEEYYKFTECSDELFEEAREKALEKYGRYVPNKH